MIKRVTLALLIAGCFSNTVYAQTMADIKNKNGNVTVTGTAPADTVVTFTVKSTDADGKYYAIKEAVSDGAFFFDVELMSPVTDLEIYNYEVKVQGDTSVTKSIKVYKDANAQLANLRTTDTALLELLKSADELDKFENLGLNTSVYTALTEPEQKTVLEAFVKDIVNEEDGELAEILNADIAVLNSKKAQSFSDFESVLNGADKTKSEWEKVSDFAKNSVFNTMNYTTFEELVTELKLYDAINTLNTLKYAELEQFFADNAKLLEIAGTATYTRYVGLNETQKIKVNEKIVETLYNNPAKTKEDVAAVINTGLGAITITPSIIGGGSSGSSGGGNTSGGKGSTSGDTSLTFSKPPEIKPIVKPPLFADVTDEFWAKTAVEALAEKKVINGYEDGTFKPDKEMTREEFVTIVVNAFELLDKNADSEFEDVNNNDWFYNYVSSAYKAGIVSGVSETSFGVGAYITRQDVALIISRAMKIGKASETEAFTDDESIADYAKDAVYALREKEIINGFESGEFLPLNKCTRAECATMIAKATGLI